MQSEADIERPLKQRIAKLERENAKLREACEAIVGAWDGSLGEDAYNAAVGLAEEKIRAALAQEGERE